MNKKEKFFLIFAIIIAISATAFCDACITPVGSLLCTPGVSAQCACMTKFELRDSGGNLTNNFTAGDTVFVSFKVENVGTTNIQNLKFFVISANGNSFLNGVYSQTIIAGVDLAVGETYEYNNFPVVSRVHLQPSNFNFSFFVSSSSNYYFDIPNKVITINNPDPAWVATTSTRGIRKNGTIPWLPGETLLPAQLFDFQLTVKNENPASPITIRLYLDTRPIQSCNIFPPGFNIGTGTVTSFNEPIAAGATNTYYFEGCRLDPAYEIGLIYLTYSSFTITDNSLVDIEWPYLISAVPNVGYYNIWADKPFLQNGETTTFSSEFDIRYGDLPPNSTMVFRFLNVRDTAGNLVAVPDEVINFPAGLPKNDIVTPQYTRSVAVSSYAGALPSFDFTVNVTFYDAAGTVIRRIWGNPNQAFAPVPPVDIVDLQNGTAVPGTNCLAPVISGTTVTTTCTLNAGENVLLQSTVAPANIQIAGGSAAIQYTGTNTKILALSPATITITILLPTPVPDLEIPDALLIILAATGILFVTIRKRK